MTNAHLHLYVPTRAYMAAVPGSQKKTINGAEKLHEMSNHRTALRKLEVARLWSGSDTRTSTTLPSFAWLPQRLVLHAINDL